MGSEKRPRKPCREEQGYIITPAPMTAVEAIAVAIGLGAGLFACGVAGAVAAGILR